MRSSFYIKLESVDGDGEVKTFGIVIIGKMPDKNVDPYIVQGVLKVLNMKTKIENPVQYEW